AVHLGDAAAELLGEAAAVASSAGMGARALVESGAVDPDDAGATVRSAGQVYRVRRLADDAYTCTCPWWAKHRGQRGPCKHALATRMAGVGEREAV
ncbi:SWIM zinc finger family protein, partial [Micromonospora carbonacea]|uniref:SWIM zinc finger family protein n=1 Tax=Micromonospora carbonacea TaxID=47853 RepID=UPI0033F8E3D2